MMVSNHAPANIYSNFLYSPHSSGDRSIIFVHARKANKKKGKQHSLAVTNLQKRGSRKLTCAPALVEGKPRQTGWTALLEVAAVSGRTGSRRSRQHSRDDGLPGPRAGRFEETLGLLCNCWPRKSRSISKNRSRRGYAGRAWQNWGRRVDKGRF